MTLRCASWQVWAVLRRPRSDFRAGPLLAMALLVQCSFAYAQSAQCPESPGSGTLRAAPGPSVGGLEAISKDYSRRIKRINRRGAAPGIAVAVIEHGRLSWSAAAGFTQRRGKQAFQPDTVVPLGRLSEIPIALSAVRRAREGQLDLNEPLTQVPEALLQSAWTQPSLRQLLAHQGGLNGGRLHDLYVKQEQTHPPPGPMYPIRAPGLLESYSLVGYRLAYNTVERRLETDLSAAIIEDLAQLRAPRCAPSRFTYALGNNDARGHLDKNVLDPLTASDTAVLGLRGNLHGMIDLVAPLTDLDGKTNKRGEYGSYARADFAELVRQTPGGKLDFGRRGGLGFSLNESQREGVGLVALAFGMPPGYRTEIRIALDHQTAVIVIANGGDEEDVDDLGSDLLDDVLTARKGLPARVEDLPLPERVELPDTLSPAPWAQRYATPIGRLKIERVNENGFDFEIFGRPFRATMREDGWYKLSYRLLGVIPLRFSVLKQTLLHSASWEGQSVLLAHIFGRTLLVGSAVSAGPKDAWTNDWLGEYELTNPDLLSELLEVDTVTVGKEDDLLYIEYELPFFLKLVPRVLLEPLDRTQLMVSGIGPLLGERLQISGDSDNRRMEYAGYRFERKSDR